MFQNTYYRSMKKFGCGMMKRKELGINNCAKKEDERNTLYNVYKEKSDNKGCPTEQATVK